MMRPGLHAVSVGGVHDAESSLYTEAGPRGSGSER